MASKITMSFYITKNTEKQGAWLLEIHRPVRPRQVNGNLQVALEDIEGSHIASAWTTLVAAKRAAAHHVGRSRLTWITEGDTNLVASLDIKVAD